jgi:hypothetical protein
MREERFIQFESTLHTYHNIILKRKQIHCCNRCRFFVTTINCLKELIQHSFTKVNYSKKKKYNINITSKF